MIKLIATDIDGTLIGEGKIKINPEYFQVFQEFRRRGALIVAASGRQKTSIERVFAPMKDDVIMLSENGACITSRNYCHSEVMDLGKVKDIVKASRQLRDCHCSLCCAETAYFDYEPFYRYMVDSFGYKAVLVDDLMEVEDDVVKVSVFNEKNAARAAGKEFCDLWSRELYVTGAGEKWLDFMNRGVNKGNALKIFQDKFDIQKDETLAFGDQHNDIEMLKRAAHSFAVANAMPEVKKAANFVTDSWEKDGVLKVLKAVLKGELC